MRGESRTTIGVPAFTFLLDPLKCAYGVKGHNIREQVTYLEVLNVK